MAKLAIKKASTDVTVYLFIQASNVTTGAGLTGLAYNTANLVASYVRPLAARAALSLATQTVDGAHADGGFVEVDATNMPGIYRLDLPDAVCAAGVNSVVVMLKGAANMSPVVLELQLTTNDPNDVATATALATVDDLVDDLETRLTAARAGYLDNLSAGAVALEATLTAMASYIAANVNDSLTSGTITQIRGNTWDFPLPNVVLGATKQWFAIKRKKSDPDSAALLLMNSHDGVTVLNGAPYATGANGTLTLVGTTLTIHLEAAASALIPGGNKFYYGAQGMDATGDVGEPYGGTFVNLEDVVQATS